MLGTGVTHHALSAAAGAIRLGETGCMARAAALDAGMLRGGSALAACHTFRGVTPRQRGKLGRRGVAQDELHELNGLPEPHFVAQQSPAALPHRRGDARLARVDVLRDRRVDEARQAVLDQGFRGLRFA